MCQVTGHRGRFGECTSLAFFLFPRITSLAPFVRCPRPVFRSFYPLFPSNGARTPLHFYLFTYLFFHFPPPAHVFVDGLPLLGHFPASPFTSAVSFSFPAFEDSCCRDPALFSFFAFGRRPPPLRKCPPATFHWRFSALAAPTRRTLTPARVRSALPQCTVSRDSLPHPEALASRITVDNVSFFCVDRAFG